MGVQADGRPHLGVPVGELDRPPRRRQVGPHAHQRLDPRLPGLSHRGVGVVLRSLPTQVAVAVDPAAMAVARVTTRCRSEGRGARPCPGASRRAGHPTPPPPGGAGPRGCRGGPAGATARRDARGISGDARSATMRSASRQSPEHRRDRVRVTGLVERPRLLFLDVRVRGADEVPHRAEATGVVELLEPRGEHAEGGGGGLDQRPVGTRVGHHPAAVVHRHVEHPVGQVAEVVGEIGVVARHHRLVAEVAVGTEALVDEEVVAEAVDAELVDQVGGRDLVERASCSSSRRRPGGSRARTPSSVVLHPPPSASPASRPRAGGGCPCR